MVYYTSCSVEPSTTTSFGKGKTMMVEDMQAEAADLRAAQRNGLVPCDVCGRMVDPESLAPNADGQWECDGQHEGVAREDAE